MPLSVSDAERILRFCLGADDAGWAKQRADGSCLVTVALCRSSHEVLSFHGRTFEEALRAAGDAEAVNPVCINKQIAFLQRIESGPAPPAQSLRPTAPATPPADTDTASFLALTDAVATLLHETQLERGMSTLFVGSGGRLLGAELDEQRRRADLRHRALLALVNQAAVAPPPVVVRLERAQRMRSAISDLRADIDAGAVSAPPVIETFSAINAEFLSAVETFMHAGGSGARRPAVLACLALLHAKEKAGIERAHLASAFVADRIPSAQRLAVAALIAAQSSYLHVFSATAPARAKQMLLRTLASPAESEVRRMESVVYGQDDHGFGIDPSDWFATITRKIDMLRDVGNVTLSLLRDNR